MKDREAIDRISRSWAGHLATRTDLRAAAAEARDDRLADIINTTIAPRAEDVVSADDIPAIKSRIHTFFSTLETGDGGTTGINRGR